MFSTLIILDKYYDENEIKSIESNYGNIIIYPINNSDYLNLSKFKNKIINEKKYFNNSSHKFLQEFSENIKNNIRYNLKIKLGAKNINSLKIWISNLFIKKILNNKLKIIYSLDNIINKYNINHIFYFFEDVQNNCEIINKISNSANIPIKFYKYKNTNIKKKNFYLIPKFIWHLNNALVGFLSNSYITSKNYRNEEIITKFFKIKNKKILISENRSLLSIIKNYFSFNLYTLVIIPKNNTSINYEFNYDNFSKNFTQIMSYDFNKYFEKSFLNFFNLLFPQAISKCEFISSYFQKYKPDLIVSTDSDYLNGFIGEISSFFNINAYCITHGTHTYPKNLNEVIYQKEIGESVILNYYPNIFSQSIFCDEFLNYYKVKSKIIKSEPLVFAPKDKYSPHKKTLLHASTIKTEASTKFWGVESFQEYLSSIHDILKLSNALNYKLIIKLHPAFKNIAKKDDLKNYFDDENIDITNDSFKSCLDKSDILISFSSTTIEEALYNHRPVILYDNNNRYNHLDAIKLSNLDDAINSIPYFYCNDYKILKKKIDLVYEKHIKKEFSFDWIFNRR